MCFRPAEVSMKKCPSCGKVCKPVDKVCPDCGTELDNAAKGFDADQPMTHTSPAAPSVPAASGGPAVSGAPSAPGAPKPPNAPSV